MVRFLIFVVFLILFSCGSEDPSSKKNVDHKVFEIYGSDIRDPDPLPMTRFVRVKEKRFPNKEQLVIIGRMAQGIVEMKNGMYWECGRLLTEREDIEDLAIKYAFEIVRAAYEVSDHTESEHTFVLNPWGLAGTVRNESQFDRCAIGPHPRNKAIEIGILKKQKRSISYSESDVLKAVKHPKMQALYARSGFDLGVAQLLSRFYRNPKDYENMVSLRGSAIEAAINMKSRSRTCDTQFPERPWRCWPGSDSERYDSKVTMWAIELGAKSDEI